MHATTAAVLVSTGSAIFLVGAAIGVSRVFTEPDPAAKLRMLEGRITQWRIAQPLYAIGPLTAAIGVGFLAASSEDTTGQICLGLSCIALLAGAVCWSRSLYLRLRYVREFAFGQLPGWSFACYVCLTLVGLAALGIGQLLAGYPEWAGWLTIAGFATFLVGYVRYGDIPPFVFYLLLPIVSAGWVYGPRHQCIAGISICGSDKGATMPELLVDFITSLDGYGAAEGWPGWWGLEGPEYLTWLGEQPEADYTVLMGANTYGVMSSFAAEGEPGTDALASLSKVVFSSTLTEPLSWANTQLVRQDAVETVKEFKNDASARSMRTMGSLALCRSLLKAGLVDRFRVVVFPVITGSTGQERIYDGYPDVALDMVSTRTFDGRTQLLEYVPRVLTGPPGADRGT